jgi:hypothetical protein
MSQSHAVRNKFLCHKKQLINHFSFLARALLVVFGKETTLIKDENWRGLIEYTKQNGTYVTEM